MNGSMSRCLVLLLRSRHCHPSHFGRLLFSTLNKLGQALPSLGNCTTTAQLVAIIPKNTLPCREYPVLRCNYPEWTRKASPVFGNYITVDQIVTIICQSTLLSLFSGDVTSEMGKSRFIQLLFIAWSGGGSALSMIHGNDDIGDNKFHEARLACVLRMPGSLFVESSKVCDMACCSNVISSNFVSALVPTFMKSGSGIVALAMFELLITFPPGFLASEPHHPPQGGNFEFPTPKPSDLHGLVTTAVVSVASLSFSACIGVYTDSLKDFKATVDKQVATIDRKTDDIKAAIDKQVATIDKQVAAIDRKTDEVSKKADAASVAALVAFTLAVGIWIAPSVQARFTTTQVTNNG